MRRFIFAICLVSVLTSVSAQTPFAVVPLWNDQQPPTDNELTGPEVNHGKHISNVTEPTLTVYVPAQCNGKAVLACPGGGYTTVWVGTEGHNFASWFLEHGYAYAVLKYRMPNGHPTVPLEDCQRALAIMRQQAAEWGGYSVVGVMGSSAGGHLASTAATHYTDSVTRPDFQILCYPVISFRDGIQTESRQPLLGAGYSDEQCDYYSNELQVTPQTPPACIVVAADDTGLTPRHSMIYAEALMQHNVPVALYVYPTGNHGCTTNVNWPYRPLFFNELADFLERIPVKPTLKGNQ